MTVVAAVADTDFSCVYVLPRGADPRTARWTDALAPTIHSDNDVVDAYANLSAECRQAGHALHEKIHTADQWIAACAIAKGLDLFSGDAIFHGAPNLNVRS